ncbi:MAG: hypothetical protein VKJ04_04400 [Vampirovibrionales bacterium]|nr:hypothetical protein [Vampirovibrionales bacterium]
MSGSGDHLSGKLMQELRSAFALIFKNLGTDGVDLGIRVDTVIYPCLKQGRTQELKLQTFSSPRLRNALSENNFSDCKIERVPLYEQDAPLCAIPCSWQATLVSEPILADATATLCSVDFDNIRHPADFEWQISSPAFSKNRAASPVMNLPVPVSSTKSLSVNLPKLEGPKGLHDLPVQITNKKSHTFPSRLWQLPFIKRPLPPHRFSSEIKNRMRQALAEKAGVNPASVQIQVIFDRINLGLFASIDQDEKGNLICHPKPDVLHQPEKARHFPSAYLVFGIRMDTKETLKALVPMQDQEKEILKNLD